MRLESEISTKCISVDDLLAQSFTDSEGGSVPNLLLEFKPGASELFFDGKALHFELSNYANR